MERIMKKKTFAILIVAVVATFAGYNAYQSQRAETMSDLLLANVEALASREGGTHSCEEVCHYCSGWRCTRIYGGVTSVCEPYRKN